MKNKLPILLAVLALIASSLACALGEMSLSNPRTSFDSDGNQTSSTFSANDTIYTVADLANAPAGTVVATKWIAVNAEGLDPNFLIAEGDISTTEESFSGIIYFSSAPPWPTGSYQIEWYLNGVLSQTSTFTVP